MQSLLCVMRIDSYRRATLALKESRNLRDASGNIKEVISSESIDDAVAAFQDEVILYLWCSVFYLSSWRSHVSLMSRWLVSPHLI